jgi:hypothetical protein
MIMIAHDDGSMTLMDAPESDGPWKHGDHNAVTYSRDPESNAIVTFPGCTCVDCKAKLTA